MATIVHALWLAAEQALFYYMALSRKDWELPNSRIWLAEMDIYCGLDFSIWTGIWTGKARIDQMKSQIVASNTKLNLWRDLPWMA